MNITIRNVPPELFKAINKRRLTHMEKCDTCKYGLGVATVAYIRELIKENNELKKNQKT